MARWWDGTKWTAQTAPLAEAEEEVARASAPTAQSAPEPAAPTQPTPYGTAPSAQSAPSGFAAPTYSTPAPSAASPAPAPAYTPPNPYAFNTPQTRPAPLGTAMDPQPRGPRTALKVVIAVVSVTIVSFLLWIPLGMLVSSTLNSTVLGEQEELTATPGDDWSTMPVLVGNGYVGYDPSWTDVTEQMGLDEYAAMLNESSGLQGTFAYDAVWLTSGDVAAGGTPLFLASVTDGEAGANARIEAMAFLGGVSGQSDESSLQTLSETAIHTSNGLTGYLMDYSVSANGVEMFATVGVVVDGTEKVYVCAMAPSDTSTLQDGHDDVEAMLNSLTIGE